MQKKKMKRAEEDADEEERHCQQALQHSMREEGREEEKAKNEKKDKDEKKGGKEGKRGRDASLFLSEFSVNSLRKKMIAGRVRLCI